MPRSNRFVAFIVLLCALCGCGPHQPEKPLELSLKLSKNRIKTGEYLWYLLEMKNIGRKPVTIKDPAWFRQNAITGFGQTHLEIIGPDGDKAAIHRYYNPYSTHGIFGKPRFWANDCGGGKDCDELFGRYDDSWPFQVVQGGETWSATPSMVAPIRPRRPNVLDDPGDPRDLPEIPKDWPKEKVEALRKRWKETVEESGFLMGDPTFKPGPNAPSVSQPQGYRILDDCVFEKPGPYRMRIVYKPFDFLRAEAMEEWLREGYDPIRQKVEAWIKGPFYALKDHLRKHGWPEETRVFRFESNWVEFEVEAAPFPEHMFHRSAGQSAKERALTERLRNEMKENFLWAEDSPQGRERKLQRYREKAASEKRRRAELLKIGNDLLQGKRAVPSQETRTKKSADIPRAKDEIPLLDLGGKTK